MRVNPLRIVCLSAAVVPLLIAFWIIVAVVTYQTKLDKVRRADAAPRFMGLPAAPDCRQSNHRDWADCRGVPYK